MTRPSTSVAAPAYLAAASLALAANAIIPQGVSLGVDPSLVGIQFSIWGSLDEAATASSPNLVPIALWTPSSTPAGTPAQAPGQPPVDGWPLLFFVRLTSGSVTGNIIASSDPSALAAAPVSTGLGGRPLGSFASRLVLPDGATMRAQLDAAAVAGDEVDLWVGDADLSDLQATSSSAYTPHLGAFTFITQSGKRYRAGMLVRITFSATVYVDATVTSYSTTHLVVDVTAIHGTGSHSSWAINFASAPPGYRYVTRLRGGGQSFVMGVGTKIPSGLYLYAAVAAGAPTGLYVQAIAGAAGGSPVPIPSVTEIEFRPGEPSGNGHYESWAEVQALLPFLATTGRVVVNDSLQPAIVPADSGQTDFGGSKWLVGYIARVRGLGTPPILTVEDGAELFQPQGFEDLTVKGECYTASALRLASAGVAPVIKLAGSAGLVFADGLAAVPFCVQLGALGGTIQMDGFCQIDTLGGAVGIFDVAAGATVFLQMTDTGALVGIPPLVGDCITGGAGGDLKTIYDASAGPAACDPALILGLWAGTFSYLPMDQVGTMLVGSSSPKTNVIAKRISGQGPVALAKAGQVNLGTDGDGTLDDYATIGGGQDNRAAGQFATVAGGHSNEANGIASFAAGETNQATGRGSSVLGQNNEAGGAASVALGAGNSASGDQSVARGLAASATRAGQWSDAAGTWKSPTLPLGTPGDAQAGLLVLRAKTAGAFPDEISELTFGLNQDQLLFLEDGKAYAFKAIAVAIATTGDFARFESNFVVKQSGGALTLIADPTTSINSGGNAAVWTFFPQVNAGLPRLGLEFQTGALTTNQTRVVCRLEWAEVLAPQAP